jgi:hypothetical protein
MRMRQLDELAARFGSGVEQLGADGHEAVKEVGVRGLEAGVAGLQRRGESVLGGQEVNEQVDPLRQRGVRCARQQGWSGLGAGIGLVAVDGDDEVCPGREVAVDRAQPDSGLGRDVAYRHGLPFHDFAYSAGSLAEACTVIRRLRTGPNRSTSAAPIFA